MDSQNYLIVIPIDLLLNSNVIENTDTRSRKFAEGLFYAFLWIYNIHELVVTFTTMVSALFSIIFVVLWLR